MGDLVKRKIIERFGTITRAAEKLGVDESTLHRNIKRLTPKFRVKLRNIGISVPYQVNMKNPPVIIDMSEELIKSLRAQIVTLEALVKEQCERIKYLEKGK